MSQNMDVQDLSHRSRRTTAVLACVALSGVALAGLAAPAYAGTVPSVRSGTTLAICTVVNTGTYQKAVDPGGSDAPEADTVTGTGVLNCVDASGKPLIAGTSTYAVNLTGAECTGDVTGQTITEKITWSDGTRSTVTLAKNNAVELGGVATVTDSGSISAASTRFAGSTVTSLGTADGKGCGSAQGETSQSDVYLQTFVG